MPIKFKVNPSAGDRRLAKNGRVYKFNGHSWTTRKEVEINNNRFKYRSIYTRGYVSGGYKNSSPWRNVNRTVHATDTTTNLGDLLDRNAAYTMAGYSDYNKYIYNSVSGGTHASLGNYTNSISMVNEVGRAHSSTWDTPNSFTGYGDLSVVLDPGLVNAYLIGGGYNACKHNLVTEVMGAHGSAGNYSSSENLSFQGEKYGWHFSTNSPGSINLKFEFKTETYSAGGLSLGTNDGWGKALSTKDGWAYVKASPNIGSAIHKVSDVTGSNLRTDLVTPDGNAGEENYQSGQEHGYCLGHYNGAQNNNTYKIAHPTDTLTSLGSDAQPKGHDGCSSAGTAPASSGIIGGL